MIKLGIASSALSRTWSKFSQIASSIRVIDGSSVEERRGVKCEFVPNFLQNAFPSLLKIKENADNTYVFII